MTHQSADTDTGCGCIPADTTARSARITADLLQARSIGRHLADITGMPPGRWSAAHDPGRAAAVVRVDTRRGLFTLVIPPPGTRFPVFASGQRAGALDARRVPATPDSLAATLFAYFLRDRAALDTPALNAPPMAQNMV